MLQALLALALVIAFLPMFVKKVADKNINRANIAAVLQISAAFDAARAFVYEEFDNFPNGIKIYGGQEFVEKLEPFGLPLGFVPVSPIGQNMSLIVTKSGKNILAVIALAGGNISEMRRAEILARVGFWGAVVDSGILKGATGGWEMAEIPNKLQLNPTDILVRVPEDEEFSEMVVRNAKNPLKNVFHADLDMDDNNMTGVRTLSADKGDIKTVSATDFRLSGVETDRKNKNDVGSLRANKVWFQSADGNPLTITRADLKTGIFAAASIANFGDPPTLAAKTVTARDFNMTAGRTGFAGPDVWTINTGADFVNITLHAERITIASFLDTSRGQDVFLDENGESLEYAAGSGVRANVVKTDNIILRDQISSDLLAGGTGPVLLEIRPAGVSVLPDVQLAGIENDAMKIPADAADNTGKTETCRSIIQRHGGRYDALSLSDSIVCQFVMYNRIERRLEIKKCLMDGGTKCD